MSTILEVFAAALNSLWQAALAAALVWLALRLLPKIGVRFNAATRYVIWWAALAVVLVLPAGPRAMNWWHNRAQKDPVETARLAADRVTVTTLAPDPPVMVTLKPDRTATWPYWILALWAALCLYRLSQIARSYLYLRQVKRRASLAPQALPAIPRAARLLVSTDIVSPMAVGFLRPAVILPESLAEEITPQELDHVLLHEAAHLVRKDDWTNLAARLLGAALVLHPVAWWILREIDRERETACDDWVVARTGEARPYAASLARMFELRASRPRAASGEALASGIGSGSRLGERIESLLKRGREFSPRTSLGRVFGSALAMLCLLAAGSLAPRWIALAKEMPSFASASVKLTSPERRNLGHRLSCEEGTRFDAMSQSLRNLINLAYGGNYRRDEQILGGPDWVKSEEVTFDIDAKVPHKVSFDECRLMLQTLLADRFKLELHVERKELPVYQLSVGNKGSKLRAVGQSDPVQGLSNILINGDPIQVATGYEGVASGRGMRMEQLANFISGLPAVQRTVIDKTGLDGLYSLHLDFAWTPGHDDDRPDIFTAVQEQLGLKLTAAKGPIEVLVIDHAEKPGAN